MRRPVMFIAIAAARESFWTKLALKLFNPMVDDENVIFQYLLLSEFLPTRFTLICDVRVMRFDVLFQRTGTESLAAFAARLFGFVFLLFDAPMRVAHMRVQTSAAQLNAAKGASDA